MSSIFSVGHSNHTWAEFARILDQNNIGCLIDVRSNPRSRLDHFSRPNFHIRLSELGISYVHLGAKLGGMPKCGPDSYEAMAWTSEFNDGLDEVEAIASRCRAVICCAEHDAIQCHRFLLVSRHLSARGHDVLHILRDGSVETQADTEARLMKAVGLDDDLFRSRDERLSEAYRRQERKLRGRAG